MSLVARIALGVAVLAVLAVGAVIFYILPQLGAPDDSSTAAVSAPASSPSDTPAPASTPSPAAPASSQADYTPAPAPAPVPAAPSPAPAATPAPASPGFGFTPSAPTPAPAPVQAAPVPAPSPAPAPAPIQSAGAPIPLAPAPSPPPAPSPSPAAAPASAPLNPAAPGSGNIAEFVNQTMTMGGTADARSAPLAEASVLTRLTKGSPVKVVGVLAGNLWLQVELADQRTAYVPAAAIPDATSPGPGTPSAPAPAGSIAAGSNPGAAKPSFMAVSEQLTTTAPTPVYGAPEATGAPKQVLKPGTAVQIIAKTNDGQWGWLQTPDGQEAYVQMATLSAGPPAPAVLPDTIAGRVKVVNTATLIVDGQKLQLFGVRGEGGTYAVQLRSLLESQGNVVSCHRRGTQYTCTLPGDVDIARAALFNGAARPAANAPADYQDQAASARDARRGVWGQ
jgi:hypothetical protein